MTTLAPPPLDADAVSRLLEGRHDDPFAVLGPHRRSDALWVTAFDPGAEEMAAVVAGREHPLAPVTGGLFAGPVPDNAAYRLRARGHGSQWEHEDPYRFGPVLSDLDKYLL